MTRSTLTACAVPAALVIFGILASAGSAHPPEAAGHAAVSPEPAPSLGRTIKLQFTLKGPEEQPEFFVLTASRDYEIDHDVSEPNFEHHVGIRGRILPTDDPEQFFVTFAATMLHADLNEAFEANFKAEGSVLVELREPRTLTRLGDQPLVLEAMPAE